MAESVCPRCKRIVRLVGGRLLAHARLVRVDGGLSSGRGLCPGSGEDPARPVPRSGPEGKEAPRG